MLPFLLLACTAVEPALTGLTVTENPGSPLTATARWTTTVPATSRVEFSDGEGVWAVGSDPLVTEHEVVIVGMTADTFFDLDVLSETVDGELLTAAETWVTPELGYTVPQLDLVTADAGRVQPGWTLLNFVVDDLLNSPAVVAMLDERGEIVWSYQVGEATGPAGVQARWCGDRISIGGSLPPTLAPVEVRPDGTVLWEGDPQPADPLGPGTQHHTLQCRTLGGWHLALFYDRFSNVMYDIASEYDDEGAPLWEWSSIDHIPEARQYHIHANMVLVDDEHAWVNFYISGQIVKIDKASGEILWTLGPGGDFELLDGGLWFEGCHGMSFTDEGHLLLYDNAGGLGRPWSRAVEYELDEEAMTVRQVWSWPEEDLGEDAWLNWIWGDVDRLPNGNTLVSLGSMWDQDANNRIVELTPDDEVVWDLRFLGQESPERSGTYAVQRIPALAERIE